MVEPENSVEPVNAVEPVILGKNTGTEISTLSVVIAIEDVLLTTISNSPATLL